MGEKKRTPFKMSRRATTVKDVPADQFIKKCAEFLKRQPKFQVPKWADLVKTGHFKELLPTMRTGSMCVLPQSPASSTSAQAVALVPFATGMAELTAAEPA